MTDKAKDKELANLKVMYQPMLDLLEKYDCLSVEELDKMIVDLNVDNKLLNYTVNTTHTNWELRKACIYDLTTWMRYVKEYWLEKAKKELPERERR
jgi:hypothetical protein